MGWVRSCMQRPPVEHTEMVSLVVVLQERYRTTLPAATPIVTELRDLVRSEQFSSKAVLMLMLVEEAKV